MAIIVRSKNTVYGLNNDLLNLKNASGLDANLNYVKVADASYIADASSVKNATKLLDAQVKLSADALGVVGDLTTDATTVVGAINEHDAEIGDMSTITTTETTVVGAVNEHDLELGDISTVAIADGSATDVAGMLNDLEAAKPDISKNLSDLADIAAARTNLDVNSTSEIDDKIHAAELAMGTNYDVEDIDARDALTDLDVADRVFVQNDGDDKWALYKVQAVDDDGKGTNWTKLSDQDSLENSISADSIKSAYESNDDTNAYTDAELAKVGFVTVTEAVDLDKVVQNDELIVDTALAGATDLNIGSTLAVKTYIDDEAAKLLEISNNLSDVADVPTARTNLDVYSKEETDDAIGSGGANFITETVTVSSDTITLANAPKNGVISNFTCVRNIDENGVASDIPTTASDDDELVFNIHPDSAGQFDDKDVMVQYAYATA